ncbi:hypothetical protein QE250_14150 [Chromatiaceae bacterium AAb-1]|jgi:hypothetical protein|nr:hypothetical protein [Chromatiaceae bacterium AAb-1]
MKNYFLLAVFLAVFSGSATSATIVSGWTKIIELYPTREGLMFITEYKNVSLSTCEDGARFALKPENPEYTTQSSAIIAAFIAQKEINMTIEVRPAACNGVVDRFRVRR